MKKWLIGIFLLICHAGVHADWMPASQLIPPGSSNGVEANVYTAYDPVTGNTVAAWANNSPKSPYFAIYDGSSWTTAGTPIPSAVSLSVIWDVTLVYNPSNQTVIAAWGDSNTDDPYYAVFDGSTWTTPGTLMQASGITNVYTNINMTYDQATQTIVAAWTESSSRAPVYATFDGSTWTTRDVIPLGLNSTGVYDDVIVTYDAERETVIAAWADRSSQLPYYAVWNGTSWIVGGTSIPAGTSTVIDNISLVYYPTFQSVIAVWTDDTTNFPYYSVFDGTSWTTASLIPRSTSDGVYGNLGLAFNTDSQTIFASWSDSNVYIPYYSIFNGITWESGPIPYLPSRGVDYDILLSYNESAHQMVATWGMYPGNPDPYYQIFTTVIEPPQPPTNVAVRSCYNKFATQKIKVNIIEWEPSPSLSTVGYKIYSNGILIAEVDAETFSYNVQGICKGRLNVYGVRSVAANGLESSIVTILP